MLSKSSESPSRSQETASEIANNPLVTNPALNSIPLTNILDISAQLPLASNRLDNSRSLSGTPNEIKEAGSHSNSHDWDHQDSESTKVIVCSICSKTFTTYSNLRQHSQIHETKDKRSFYTCSFCDKAYLYKCSLNKHMKSHTPPSLPTRENIVSTTLSDESHHNLEPTLAKKVKVEENPEKLEYIEPQSLEEKLKEFIENHKNYVTPAITQGFSLFYSQKLAEGGTQNLKITIEPVENATGSPDEIKSEEQPQDQILPQDQIFPPQNITTKLLSEHYTFLEKLLKPLQPNPYADLRFQFQNGINSHLFF